MNILKYVAIGMVAAVVAVGCASSESAEKKQSQEAASASNADEQESAAEETGGSDEGSSETEGENPESGAQHKSSENGDGADVSIEGSMRKAGTGKLADETIKKELGTAEKSVRLCYKQQLDLNEDASGKVILNFKIKGSGEVASAEVQVDSVGGAIGECVAGVVETLEFPGPEGGPVIVNKTYAFQKAE